MQNYDIWQTFGAACAKCSKFYCPFRDYQLILQFWTWTKPVRHEEVNQYLKMLPTVSHAVWNITLLQTYTLIVPFITWFYHFSNQKLMHEWVCNFERQFLFLFHENLEKLCLLCCHIVMYSSWLLLYNPFMCNLPAAANPSKPPLCFRFCG